MNEIMFSVTDLNPSDIYDDIYTRLPKRLNIKLNDFLVSLEHKTYNVCHLMLLVYAGFHKKKLFFLLLIFISLSYM